MKMKKIKEEYWVGVQIIVGVIFSIGMICFFTTYMPKFHVFNLHLSFEKTILLAHITLLILAICLKSLLGFLLAWLIPSTCYFLLSRLLFTF